MMIGIVPITCEELFKGIEAKKGTEAEYQVVLNMLEIYNEQVGRCHTSYTCRYIERKCNPSALLIIITYSVGCIGQRSAQSSIKCQRRVKSQGAP